MGDIRVFEGLGVPALGIGCFVRGGIVAVKERFNDFIFKTREVGAGDCFVLVYVE